MEKVIRFDLSAGENIEPFLDGDYVRYQDYARVEENLRAATKALQLLYVASVGYAFSEENTNEILTQAEANAKAVLAELRGEQ